MLVRDVMSSPVVTVAPGTHLKQVADLLVQHEISAVPVVEGDALVGIVSEADLVPLELTPDPRAHLAPVREPPSRRPRVAEVMTQEVVALLNEELGPPSPYRVSVRDGVVELTGPADPTVRRLATLLVRGVPGVVEVRFTEG